MNWLSDPNVFTTKTSSSSALNALSLSTDATQKQPTERMYLAADEMSEADAPAAFPTLSWGHVQIRLPTMVTPAPTICRGVKRLPKIKDDKRIVQARLDWENTWEKFGRVGESKLAGHGRGKVRSEQSRSQRCREQSLPGPTWPSRRRRRRGQERRKRMITRRRRRPLCVEPLVVEWAFRHRYQTSWQVGGCRDPESKSDGLAGTDQSKGRDVVEHVLKLRRPNQATPRSRAENDGIHENVGD
jgi:hypothetical protein